MQEPSPVFQLGLGTECRKWGAKEAWCFVTRCSARATCIGGLFMFVLNCHQPLTLPLFTLTIAAVAMKSRSSFQGTLLSTAVRQKNAWDNNLTSSLQTAGPLDKFTSTSKLLLRASFVSTTCFRSAKLRLMAMLATMTMPKHHGLSA